MAKDKLTTMKARESSIKTLRRLSDDTGLSQIEILEQSLALWEAQKATHYKELREK